MKLQLKIHNEIIFELAFFHKEDNNTFYYFGFAFLFLGIYLWRWSDVCNFTLSVYAGIPYTSKIIMFEKYLETLVKVK
jgi:membrane-bound acyltransferase YfiQ involved in biofilm formation